MEPKEYLLGDIVISREDVTQGENKLLIEASGSNLILDTTFNDLGYYISKKALSEAIFNEAKEQLTAHVKSSLADKGISVEGFSLENYHRFVPDDETHYSISTWALESEAYSGLVNRVAELLQSLLHREVEIKPIDLNGQIKSVIGFRIIRPGSTDYSPMHRDAWLDIWKDVVNVWIPVGGCNPSNIIRIIPKSHYWNDQVLHCSKEGALINYKKYKVRAAISSSIPPHIQTPDMDYQDVLVFSPYLLHGNGSNLTSPLTRTSIEMRFWLKSR